MIYDSIIDTVGRTPLVRVPKLSAGLHADIALKLEFFNPLSSVKDRIAKAMIESAEAKGLITSGTHIIESTSGNTGIGLAFICAAKGYKLTLVMPETMSYERRALLLMLGAEVILTPGPLGMTGANKHADKLAAEGKNTFVPSQFANPANPEVHEHTTAEEIWADTDGKVDIFVAGVGTGGTLTGCARTLKKHKSTVKVVAVEPEESPVISGGAPSPHKIQGIGAGFIPDNLDTNLVDNVIRVTSEDALAMARKAIKEEGIPMGISSGAALSAALRLAADEANKGKLIVAIIPSSTERYLSTPLAKEAFEAGKALPTVEVE